MLHCCNFQISENLLKFKALKSLRKLPYFVKNHLCACFIYACTGTPELGGGGGRRGSWPSLPFAGRGKGGKSAL